MDFERTSIMLPVKERIWVPSPDSSSIFDGVRLAMSPKNERKQISYLKKHKLVFWHFFLPVQQSPKMEDQAPKKNKEYKFKKSEEINSKKRLIVVLENACLETVKTKKGSYELLNCDDHLNMLKKMNRDWTEVRPDITHQVCTSFSNHKIRHMSSNNTNKPGTFISGFTRFRQFQHSLISLYNLFHSFIFI